MASFLTGFGGLVSGVSALAVGPSFGGVLLVVCWVVAAGLGLVAAATIWKASRVAAAIGVAAVVVGVSGTLVAAALPFWLLPGLLLGLGSAFAAGARFAPSPRTTAIVLAVIGASMTTLLVAPFAYGAGLIEAEGGSTIDLPLYLEILAVLGFVAGAVMARWLRVGGVIALLVALTGTAMFVVGAIAGEVGPLAWLPWLVGGAPLTIGAFVALRRHSTSAKERE